MNKNYIILLVIVAVLIIGALIYKNKEAGSPFNNEPKIKIDNTTKRPDLSNATFGFENQEITLKNGRSELELEGTSLVQVTTLTDKIVYADLNSDRKEDAVALLLQEGGGTGIFIYLTAYVSGTVRYSGTNSVFIGDRISPLDLSVTNGVIGLTYLDRAEDEPFSAPPTIETSRSFVYINGELKELR